LKIDGEEKLTRENADFRDIKYARALTSGLRSRNASQQTPKKGKKT
jgi:hypothetical protein